MSCGDLCMTCRDMKKYKKDFMQSLSCALLVMKSDNSIKHLRGPRKEKISFRRYDDASPVKSKEINQYSSYSSFPIPKLI